MRLTRVTPWLLLGASTIACSSKPHASSTAESAPVAIATGRAEIGEMRGAFEAGGIVRARATTAIASRVMAQIADVRVRAGDRVRRGTVLVTLDARESRANSNQAERALAAAVEAARASDSDVRAAEANLQLARATHDRIDTLHEKRSATPQELDQAVAALTAAQAQLESARARAAAASAARETAAASAQAAATVASYATLTAPFDGIVSARMIDPGSMALPGTPLLTLEDPATFRLEVQIDEARAALVALDQTAEVRLDNGPTDWTAGRVREIARVDPASHSFLVKVDIPDSPALRSGLFGRARFAGKPRKTLSIPSTSVFRRGQLSFVFVVDGEGRARLRPIGTGETARDRTEVLAGLRAGEVVVLEPAPTLTDGIRVAAGSTPASRRHENGADR